MAENIIRGNVYWATDEHIKLVPADQRTNMHAGRPFLVLSGTEHNEDPKYPIVFGCPLSTSTTFRVLGQDVTVPAAATHLGKRCWVRISHAQPVLKTELGEWKGRLPPDVLEEVEVRLLEMMGIAI